MLGRLETAGLGSWGRREGIRRKVGGNTSKRGMGGGGGGRGLERGNEPGESNSDTNMGGRLGGGVLATAVEWGYWTEPKATYRPRRNPYKCV
jgi:hypothetical protein